SASGEVLGRLAVLENRRHNDYNHECTAFFYLFECHPDAQAASALFAAGMEWAHGRGLTRIYGPKGFTALDGMGLLVRGFEHRPAFGIAYNPDYYPKMLLDQGFEASPEVLSGYLNREVQFPEKVFEVARRVQERRGLKVINFRTRGELRRMLPGLKEMYNNSLSGTHGNVPLTDEEVQAMASQMLWFADPRLIKIIFNAEDQPVGFLFAYPDISAAMQRTRGRLFPFGWADILMELRRTTWTNINGAGIAEQYRGMGGTALLFAEMYKSFRDNPRFQHADIVQIGSDNERMLNELRGMGIDFYKAHQMFSKSL
ncbi:MAG TPA: hypothetical protein VFF78_07170, partial [Anaerolineaceae bacterium]|nr:hypothetical protein [Anaerolineaceae bacterium]